MDHVRIEDERLARIFNDPAAAGIEDDRPNLFELLASQPSDPAFGGKVGIAIMLLTAAFIGALVAIY